MTRILSLAFALACALPSIVFGEPLFFDNFNIADSTDFNSQREQRQTGSAGLASYRIVTSLAPDGSVVDDRFAIEKKALLMTNAGSKKGPASLCPDYGFEKLGPRYHVEVTARPINNWASILWSPFQRGAWPDASAGLSLIIQANGTWTAWNNVEKPKQVIGSGKVSQSERYRIAFDVDENSGKSLTLLINGVPVIERKPFTDNAERHYVIFQTNGQAEFDDLMVGPEEKTKASTAWVEAEDFTATNFPNGICVNSGSDGVSGSMLLRLEVSGKSMSVAKPPYFAEFKLRVPRGGQYRLWVAASTQSGSWASPFLYSIDGSAPASLKGVPSVGGGYGKAPFNVFGWVPAETLTLDAKEHTLKLSVNAPRAKDGRYVAYLDAIFLTSDLTFVPVGNHPSCSPQPTWTELRQQMTPEEYNKKLDRAFYQKVIVSTNEEVGPATSAEVLKKIKARPLEDAKSRTPEITEFGLHGMERPFVVVGRDMDKYKSAYDLLARVGVDSFRTADSCWHRLASSENPEKRNYADLDFQVASALKYGQTHLFTVGYPPAKYTVGNHILSAVKPEFKKEYEDYLREMLLRYKGNGVRYVELCNEVDAPDTWWRKSTPEMYVDEMRILKKVVDQVAPEMKTVAFAATYSRDDEKGGPNGGRRFVDKCMDLGIDQYTDAYSIHHTSHLASKDFPAFMRREIAKVNSNKPLLDTEQWGERPYPYDNIKTFARCFFLYDMKRVDFFLARDFCENGYTKAWGLFDIDWNPKVRLLAYAFSVDAMKGRKLVGVAQPAEHIEAYVLEDTRPDSAKGKRYSIVIWNNQREVDDLEAKVVIGPKLVGGFKGVTFANNWRLDQIRYNKSVPSFQVGDAPIVVYASALPEWKLMDREEFLAGVVAGKSDAPLPVSQ
ncbi:MAG: hypothetical protein ACFUZC_11220 [Chthoniobacteraceae bacterium]